MSQPIDGLDYIAGYLGAAEQTALLGQVDAQPWLSDLKRRVQHYGYRYDYARRVANQESHLGPLPAWAAALAERLRADGWAPAVCDQLIVNEYQPGQGIASHVDCVPCFGDTILSLSLGSTCVMVLGALDTQASLPILLEPGSLLVMRGAARYRWKHGIPARKTDQIGGAIIQRGRRVSLTLRTVIHR